MNTTSNARLTGNARALRKHMTRQERHLWYDFLKGLPLTVHRQKVIGPYIVDFYCAARKMVIELDGGQHYEVPGMAADRQRDAWLQDQGITVLRYCNLDIDSNFDGVCQDIRRHLDLPSP